MISIRREVLTNPPKMSGCARAALLIEQPLFREAEKKEDVIIYFHQHHYILILHFFISILISIFKLVHQYFRSILVKKKAMFAKRHPCHYHFCCKTFGPACCHESIARSAPTTRQTAVAPMNIYQLNTLENI